MAVLMVVLGGTAIVAARKDIFPFIDIPVVSVIWAYNGMSPQEMADRIVTIDERAMTTTVNDIEHIESTSYQGVAAIRVFLQPGANVEGAIAQITALSQTPRMLQEPPAAEAGASKPAAPSERAPSGIQSPSMQAPTQSANSRAGGARTR
jgi:multidrug efflux pump subunit AcrB